MYFNYNSVNDFLLKFIHHHCLQALSVACCEDYLSKCSYIFPLWGEIMLSMYILNDPLSLHVLKTFLPEKSKFFWFATYLLLYAIRLSGPRDDIFKVLHPSLSSASCYQLSDVCIFCKSSTLSNHSSILRSSNRTSSNWYHIHRLSCHLPSLILTTCPAHSSRLLLISATIFDSLYNYYYICYNIYIII